MSDPERQAGPSAEDVAEIARQLDQLVTLFEQHPHPEVRERAFDLLAAVDALHRPAVRHMAELLKQADADLFEQAQTDPAVRMLLVLYDVVPNPAAQRTSSGSGSFVSVSELTGDSGPSDG